MANAKVVVQYSGGPQVVDTNFSLGVLATADLKVTVAGYVDGLGEPVALAFTYNKTTGRVTITTPIPAPYPATVTVQRVTPIENLFVNFEGGADVTKRNLGNASKQTLMAVQELEDRIEDLEGLSDYVDEVLIEATEAAAEAAASAAIAVTAADALTAVVGGESVEFITDGRTTSYPLAYVPPDPRLMFVFLTGWKLIYEKHFVLVPNALALSGQGLLFLASVDNPYASPFTGQSVELQYTRPVEGAFVTPDDFSSRAAFEAWVAAGGALGAGRTITAGGLRYMGQPGATELPRLPGAIPVDPTLRHYGAVGDNVADDSAAILAALTANRAGLKLEHWTYRITAEVNVTATAPIQWVSSGATFRLDRATSIVRAMYVALPAGRNVIDGVFTVDANGKAYTALQMTNAVVPVNFPHDWVDLIADDIGGLNAYRTGTAFSNGDGLLIGGAMNVLSLQRARARNCRMAVGADIFGSQGVTGITVYRDNTNDLSVRALFMGDINVDTVLSEDPLVNYDQDGVKIFQHYAAVGTMPEDCFAVIGGTIRNSRNRSLKLQTQWVDARDLYIYKDATVDLGGNTYTQNPDIDSQVGGGIFTGLNYHYDGFGSVEMLRHTETVTPGKKAQGMILNGLRGVLSDGLVIPNVVGISPSTGVNTFTASFNDIHIHGGRVASILRSGASSTGGTGCVTLSNAFAPISVGAVKVTASGNLQVACNNVFNTAGVAVPFIDPASTLTNKVIQVHGATHGFTDTPPTAPVKHANGSNVGPGPQLATIKRTGTGNLINAADKDGARISGLRLDNDRTTLGDVAGHGISASGKDMVFHDLAITDYGSAAGGGGGTGLLVVPGVSGIPERVRVSDVVLTPDLAGVITVGWLLEDAQISLVSRVIAEGVVGGIGYAHELKNDAKYNSLNQLIARASNVALVYGQDGAGVDGADYNVATNIVAAACDTGLFVGEGIGNVTVGMVHDTTGAPDNDVQYGVRFSGGASKNYAGGVATFGAMDQSIYISGDRNYAEVATHDTAAEVVRFTSGSAANVVQIAHPGARTSIRAAILDESTYALDSTNANVVRSDATGERIGSISGRFWDKLGEAGVTPFSSQPWVYEHNQYAIHALITAGNTADTSGLIVSTGRDGTNSGLLTHVSGATAASNYWNIGTNGTVRVRIESAEVTLYEPLVVDNGTVGGLIASFKGNNPRMEWYDAIGLTTAAISNVDGVMLLYPDYTGVGGGGFEVRIGGTDSGQRGLVIDSALNARLFAQLHAALGTAALPAISTSTDADTGMYFLTADVLGFATGGAQRLRLENAGAVFAVPVLTPNGTAAAPSHSFSSDPDCGMFRSNTNEVSIATGGTTRVRITNSTGTFMTHPGPFANDAAAATGGVAVGETYRVTGGTLAWRQT